jgi:DNA-binding response OmpR family regulator
MVICDYRMPGMSGLALLERLDTTAPFVVVTGDPGAVAALRAHPRVAGYLVKPFSPEELLAKIEAVVKIR